MLGRLFLLFILVPLADLILLLMIAQINWLISVGSIIVSGLLGAWLVRRQGIAVSSRIRTSFSQGQIPTAPLLEGGMILLAAGLLLTPGLMTDLAGISLLIPACRRWYGKRIRHWFARRVEIRQYEIQSELDRSTVDGEFTRRESPPADRYEQVEEPTLENKPKPFN